MENGVRSAAEGASYDADDFVKRPQSEGGETDRSLYDGGLTDKVSDKAAADFAKELEARRAGKPVESLDNPDHPRIMAG